jgi:hypothetical protein
MQKHTRNNRCKRVLSPLECDKCHKMFSCQPSKSKHRKICKGLTENTLTVSAPTNTTINNIHNGNNNYVVINNFGSENLSHLSQEFIYSCLNGMKRGVCDYIEKVNFNPNVPENHNIRYEDDKIVRVKSADNTWRLRHINSVIQGLISTRCKELEMHYNNNDELVHADTMLHYNVISNHLKFLIGGIKKEVKPVYDHIIVLLKELECLYR